MQKLIAICAAIVIVAAGSFYVYDTNRCAEVEAKIEKNALYHSSTDTALAIAIYKATAKGDPIADYLTGFRSEATALEAEYEELISSKPFIKLGYTDDLTDWYTRRENLTARIKDVID